MAGFSVLMTGKDPGSDGAIGGALKTALNLTNEVALQIVGLTPVVLFSDLTRKQAQGISEALAGAQSAGAKLAVSNAPPGAMRAINWPKAPTVNGRPVAAFIDGMPPPPAGVQGRSPVSSAGARAAGTPGRAVQAKCPVCGAALIIAASGTGTHAAAPPPSAAVRPPQPRPTAPPPPPRPSDMSTGLTPRPGTVPAAAPAPKATPGGGVVVEEVGSIDDLDIGGSPPDVPEVPSAKAPPALKEPPGSSGMVASATAPMDLADFEAGFLSGGEDELLAELDANLPQAGGGQDLLAELDELPGVEVTAQPVESNMPGDSPAPMPGGEAGDFGVFVSKGKSPKLAESLAEVMGIAVEEAKALTKKAVIPVAKGISREAAEALKTRLGGMKIRAKIRQKKR